MLWDSGLLARPETRHKPSTETVQSFRSPEPSPHMTILKGSWDLVTRVIIKVTSLIITYNPN